MAAVISVEHVSKTYRLGALGGASLHADFARWWARVRGSSDPLAPIGTAQRERQTGQLFRALNDVTFAVNEGEVLGVVGRNGAGKSTLLKIMSQVTAPSSGLIRIKGRVASLLEVGTGFHPDLTGRENVFLNGAIMGMSKSEIRAKFDEIVAFSECEEFIDTPVKRYSSGMYVRLAFAVAAHLEPEILIVDEVLAVGDAQFQKKCIGKMGEASRGGRTVLFVSHNMAAVKRLCRTALLLDDGRVSMVDTPETVIAHYLGGTEITTGVWTRPQAAIDRATVRLQEISFTNSSGTITGNMPSTEPFAIHITVDVIESVPAMQIPIRVTNQEGTPVFTSANTDEHKVLLAMPVGRHVYRVAIPGNFLAPDSYSLQVAAHVPGLILFDVVESIPFSVEDTGSIGTAVRDHRLGVVTPFLQWEYVK